MLNINSKYVLGIPSVALAFLTMTAHPASATNCVGWNAFPKSNVSTTSVKVSFVGAQERPVRSVALVGGTTPIDVKVFTACKKSGVVYGGDALPLNVNSVTANELSSLFKGAGAIPAVVAGGVATEAYVSFSLYDSLSDSGFEVVLSKPDASSLLQAIRTALAANATALRAVNAFGCFSDLLEPGTPTDVSSSVQVAFSGLRLNRTTGRFVGALTVTNKSASPLPGPISVVPVFVGQVRLHAPTALTCGLSPEGWGYLNLPLQGNSLGAGQSVTLQLDLDNPNLEPVKQTSKVYSGPGAR